MVAPATYPLSILIDGNEVISFVPFESMDFDDYAKQVSYFRMVVEDPTTVPARNNSVVISSGGVDIFNGFIIELETRKRDNGIATEYSIECADKKILLQRSVLDYTEFAGTDASILAALLAGTYPDLTGDFDFSSGVTSFLSDMQLDVNNNSLLDALNDLSDLAGGADWRFDTGGGGTTTVDFDGGAAYTASVLGASSTIDDADPSGNPGNRILWTQTADDGGSCSVDIDLGSVKAITNIAFDFKWNQPVDDLTGINFEIEDADNIGPNLWTMGFLFSSKGTVIDTWDNYNYIDDGNAFTPFSIQNIRVKMRKSTGGAETFPVERSFDNIVITTGDGTDHVLKWDNEPDATDFDFDIQNGDEFAFDIDLFEGDIDDFNSITVIGGYEDVAIDRTYESRSDLDHFNLETYVKDIVVYKNTGTDVSPTWTLQADGVWGTDSFVSDGGSKDVLYGVEDSWLWFDTNPSDLSKSIRVTGSIQKPVRVRVEDVTTGDPTYATVVHDESIRSQDEAVARGDAMLKERNSMTRINFKTYEPNLKPGQSILIADSARGLSETLKITNIKTKWLGASGNALFTVTCGQDQMPNAAIMIANNDKRSRKNAVGAALTTVTTSFLVDTDGTRLADTTGDILYEAT